MDNFTPVDAISLGPPHGQVVDISLLCDVPGGRRLCDGSGTRTGARGWLDVRAWGDVQGHRRRAYTVGPHPIYAEPGTSVLDGGDHGPPAELDTANGLPVRLRRQPGRRPRLGPLPRRGRLRGPHWSGLERRF